MSITAMSMSNEPLPLEHQTSAALAKVFSSHGYGFQYAALKRCLETGVWGCVVPEYPVTLNGTIVHIDFVLEHRDGHLLVAECKKGQTVGTGDSRGGTLMRREVGQVNRAPTS